MGIRFEATFGVNHLGHFLLSQLLLEHLETPARVIFVASGTHDPAQKTGIPPPEYTTARELAFKGKEKENENESGDKEKEKGKEQEEDAMKAGQCRYSTSKLCNVLCTYEMVRKLKDTPYDEEVRKGVPNVSIAAFDPGLMPGTGLARDYGTLMQLGWKYLLPVLTLFMTNSHTPAASGSSLARLVAEETLNIHNKYFEGRKIIRSSEESYDEEKAKDLWETSCELVGLKQ